MSPAWHRANYNDLKNGIHETTEYLEVFLRDLLLNENHPLHNRTWHIGGAFEAPEKVNIGEQKANIGTGKANIKDKFTPRTAVHVRKLLAAFGSRIVFGRSDVQSALGLKPTRSSALLREMAERGVIEPVSGRRKRIGASRKRVQGRQ